MERDRNSECGMKLASVGDLLTFAEICERTGPGVDLPGHAHILRKAYSIHYRLH